MKFVPFRLFRFLHIPPVDIEKLVKTHFEQRLEELTAQNSDYHREIIQLGNQIYNLSVLLETTEQELKESENSKQKFLHESNVLNSQVLKLENHLKGSEIQREILVERLEAHRDAFRVVVNTLTKVGAKDPNNDGL